VFSISGPVPLQDPAGKVDEALTNSFGCPSLEQVIREKLELKKEARVVVVGSNNTHPVPYWRKSEFCGR